MDTSDSACLGSTRGYVIALVSAAILSTTAIFIRHLTQSYGLPALVLAFWRDLFVVLTLLPILSWLRPEWLGVPAGQRPFLAAYGLVLAAFNSLWTQAVAINGAAIATVLVYCSAAFTALLARWLLNEPLTRAKVLAIVISLSGCLLVAEALDAQAWVANPVGIITGVLSGLGYAAYSLMGRTAAQRGLNPWTTIFHVFAVAAAALLLLNVVGGGRLPGAAAVPSDLLWLGRSTAGWAILFALAAGPTVTGFGLYNVSLGYLPSSVANLLLTVEPVFTAAIAYALLGERLTGVQIAGSAMILAGVVVLTLARPGAARRRLPAQRSEAG